ncbi:hypothetical protein [Tepidibacter hydrothermalis]|uniref:Uncharacterized protein n=1 Tax=Tepidibacter hydrothermalis TaxID=3036126 RepID=A0ABY8E709_9FIRM|nr:hypothetical protein [Tepidibacter hydrothermalis]WFD08672.1 hypothetical protein P4S50_09685 [Tepidibacter hydrothermalis]
MHNIYSILFLSSITLLLISLFVNSNKSVIKVIMILILIILIFFYSFIIYMDERKYFYFNSPNNEYMLIVEEDSFLLGGWSNFYSKEKSSIFVKNLNSRINTDDGYRPFSDKNYHLKWLDENTVEVYYYFGQGDCDINCYPKNTNRSTIIHLKTTY